MAKERNRTSEGKYDFETPRGKTDIPKPREPKLTPTEAHLRDLEEKANKQYSQVYKSYIRYYQQIDPNLTQEGAIWLEKEGNLRWCRKPYQEALITPAKYKNVLEAWPAATPPIIVAIAGVANGNTKSGYGPEKWVTRVVTYAKKNPNLTGEQMVAVILAELKATDGKWADNDGTLGVRMKLSARKLLSAARNKIAHEQRKYDEATAYQAMAKEAYYHEALDTLDAVKDQYAMNPYADNADAVLTALATYQRVLEQGRHGTPQGKEALENLKSLLS